MLTLLTSLAQAGDTPPNARPWIIAGGPVLLTDTPCTIVDSCSESGGLGAGLRVQLLRTLGTPVLAVRTTADFRYDLYMSGATGPAGGVDGAFLVRPGGRVARASLGVGARMDSRWGTDVFADLGVDFFFGSGGFVMQLGVKRGIFDHSSVGVSFGGAF